MPKPVDRPHALPPRQGLLLGRLRAGEPRQSTRIDTVARIQSIRRLLSTREIDFGRVKVKSESSPQIKSRKNWS